MFKFNLFGRVYVYVDLCYIQNSVYISRGTFHEMTFGVEFGPIPNSNMLSEFTLMVVRKTIRPPVIQLLLDHLQMSSPANYERCVGDLR